MTRLRARGAGDERCHRDLESVDNIRSESQSWRAPGAERSHGRAQIEPLASCGDPAYAQLATEETRVRTFDRQLADLADQAPRVPLDRKRVAACLVALSRNVPGVLAAGGPEARCVLQRILNGRPVACEPFRERTVAGIASARPGRMPACSLPTLVAPTGFVW